MDAIDLTLSDSDQDVRLVKRQRRSSPDDDVQVIEKPEIPTPAVSGPEPALGDKDLLITRATGPVTLAASDQWTLCTPPCPFPYTPEELDTVVFAST